MELRYQAFTTDCITLAHKFRIRICGVATRDCRISLFLISCFVLHEISLIKISAKTVDEDPAGYKRWISTKEI